MKTKLIRFWHRIIITYAKYCTTYRYVVNKKTHEIHDLWNEKTNCHLSWLSNVDFIKEDDLVSWLQKPQYNGCRWCLKKYNKS